MGRNAEWLADLRPAMVEILLEMERNASPTGRGSTQGDLGHLLAKLSRVLVEKGGRPRTEEAMRQAWWRWKTENKDEAATPPVRQLALIVRHAKNHGWLKNLTRPDCLSLVSRLMEELEKSPAAERRAMEVAWGPQVRLAVEGLIDFLENRVRKRSDGDFESVVHPDPLAVQREVKTMLTEVIERVLIGLGTPRELFKDPHDTETFLQPLEGWPDAFRQLASDVSDILNNAAKEYEEIEATIMPPQADSSSNLRRVKLFGVSSNESV